ncbi:hypothetical protein [Sphingobacterium bovistauri]|uniref:LPXTG-motif cell wall anchor domain-containing protein n=1 Tax=Sphingobacterium bovistauri TaxID=2781959 RepID=A0ABS7Z6R7_9SPHI|nr:hypothetical protein [Sphingobacterium bovistauri]MCA5005111.1 hypothetical protein [Sphingobacterium bovistauri]
MRKLGGIFFLSLWTSLGWAQAEQPVEHRSSTGYIIIGAILLVGVIIILYNKQKRRFND